MRRTYDTGQAGLQLSGSVTSLARVVGATEVTLFELRLQFGTHALTNFLCSR